MLLLPTPAAVRRPRLPATLTDLAPATLGKLLIVVAFTASGVGSVIAKAAYGMGATPVSFLLVRLVTAVVVLAVLTGPARWRLPLRKVLSLVALGMLFGAQTLAYYAAVSQSPVGLVVVIVSTYPLVVIAIDAAERRTPPGGVKVGVMLSSLVGLWLAAGSPTGRPELGVLLALASAVGYGIYLRLSASALYGVTPMVATGWLMSGALVVMAGVAVATQPSVPSAGAIGLSVLHGIAATTVPIVAIYAALQRLRTDEVAALGPLEPIVATMVASAALGEVLAPLQAVGMIVVVAAVAQLSGVRPRAGLPRLPIAVVRAPRGWAVVPRPPGLPARRRAVAPVSTPVTAPESALPEPPGVLA